MNDRHSDPTPEAVDPWSEHPIAPETPPFDPAAMLPELTSEADAQPTALIAQEPPEPVTDQPKKLSTPIAITLMVVVLIITGSVIGVLVPDEPWHSPDTPGASPSSVSPAPTDGIPFSQAPCQDTGGWSNAEKAAWLKLVAGSQQEDDGVVYFKQLPPEQRLCEGLVLSVDYWGLTVVDYGTKFGGSDYRKRLRYASTPIGHDEVVLDGSVTDELRHDELWNDPNEACTGKAITLTLEKPGNFGFSDTQMNPAEGMSYQAFANNTFVAQKIVGLDQQIGCPV